MTATFPGRETCQRTLPSDALMPARFSWVRTMYCRFPAISAGHRDVYSAASFSSELCQTRSPVAFLSATTLPLDPPQMNTTLSPSSSGESQYSHVRTLPPKSLMRCLVHFSLPVATSAQRISPWGLVAITSDPSVEGVERGPCSHGFGST